MVDICVKLFPIEICAERLDGENKSETFFSVMVYLLSSFVNDLEAKAIGLSMLSTFCIRTAPGP